MKKLILTFILFISTISFSYESKVERKRENVKKADFRITYSIIKEHEGYYAYIAFDRGGETYGGVTRNYHPHWYGWRYVDRYKKKHGRPNRNQHLEIPELDFWMQDFYLDIWVKEGFDEIRDQRLATYVFDFRVNGTKGPIVIQHTLNELGWKIREDNVIGEETIYAINHSERGRLFKALKSNRIAYYKSIARRDKTQRNFLPHWLKRAERVG